MPKNISRPSIYLNLFACSLACYLISAPNSYAKQPAYQSSAPKTIQQEVSMLSKKAPNLDPKVLQLALTAYNNAKRDGLVKKKVLTVIDYGQRDSSQRLWVFDLVRDKLLYNTYVAHGQGSGNYYAHHFSNRSGTHASSIGVYITRETYIGSKGYSLRLQGLDRGYNDNAYRREIVMHGAWYVNPIFAKNYGHIGRSWGCPSVSTNMAKPVINTIKDGSLIFAYAPNFSWLHHSRYLMA